MGYRLQRNDLYHIPDGGFTIIELLIVIVVIGILAAITIVSFNGVTDRAHDATIQSDLSSMGQQLTMNFATTGAYPLDAAGLSTIGFKASKGSYGTPIVSGGDYNALYCVTDSGDSFALISGSTSGKIFIYTNGTVSEFPKASWTGGWGTICPTALTGYGTVPGIWLYSNGSWQSWVAG